jgi:hypothetical protein
MDVCLILAFEPASFVLTAGTPVVTLGKAFYVYVIYGKNDVPVYVGKGYGRRAYIHLIGHSGNKRLTRMIAKCRKEGFEPRAEIVERFTDEVHAFALELELIARYGRRDLGTGTLYNLTEGGEGTSGSIAIANKLRTDPQFAEAHAERVRKNMLSLWADPKFREAHAEHARKHWADPKNRETRAERARETMRNPEFRSAAAERMRTQNADPEYEARRIAAIKQNFADPEFAEAHAARSREKMIKLNADPKFKKAAAERGRVAMQKLRADPKFREEQAERSRKRMLVHRADPEFTARRLAALRRAFAFRRAEKMELELL